MAVWRLALFAPVAAVLLAGLDASANEPKAKAGAGTAWVLDHGRDIPARLKRRPHLAMDGAKLSGSTGCNNFSAALVDKADKDKADKGDKQVAIEQVALTRKLCAPAQDRIEIALVRALEETRYLEHKGRRLTFLSEKHQALLVWTSGTPDAVRPAQRRRRAGRARQRRSMGAQHHWRRLPFWRGCGWSVPRRRHGG
jgi:heat shock protein HslJ